MTEQKPADAAPPATEAEPPQKGVRIDPAVALGERIAMIRFLEHRNLILAQQVHEATVTIENLTAALAAVEAKMPKSGKTKEASDGA